MNELLRRALFLPPQASTVSPEIDNLHYFVILTTMGGAVLVTLVGGYFVVRYRRKPTDPDQQPHRTHPLPLWLEALVVTGLFGLFIFWWLIGFRQFMRLRVAPEGAMDVYVIAKQWMWKFAYPDGSSSISTLYVPAGRPVRLLLTSRDVIHSFYVPDFRIKQDVVPGRYTTVWFEARSPGIRRILCAEYCGLSHSTMRGSVVVLDPPDYERWRKSPTPAVASQDYVEPAVVGQFSAPEEVSMVKQGVRVAAEAGCLRCHTMDGTPHLGPTWAGLYHSSVPLASGKTAFVDEAFITESMMDPLAQIHAGFAPIMPSFQGRTRPEETAAIIELIRSLAEISPKAPVAPQPKAAIPRGIP